MSFVKFIMLTSGPKSYYDDYVRKKDSERALTKPPALLTDRNAYINFLEVQLERVSAACFAVQSYENRFNDMQGLIVSLDERCNNTTRLISLAEQCTEVCCIAVSCKVWCDKCAIAGIDKFYDIFYRK